MFNTIKIYFLLFIIYSFLGWCMEVICNSIERKKFVNRGFLLGPYCPIYGCGGLLITVFLGNFTNRPIFLFIMTILLCGILEYSTSYVMEKLFHLRWYILVVVFFIDIIISLSTILGIKKTTKQINKENTEDNTEEITKKVKEILLGKSFVQRRLVNAYPKLQTIKIKVKEKINQTKDEIEKQKEIIDRKVTIAKKQINKKIKKVKKKKE